MATFLYRIGGFAARRAWVVITTWLVILLALGGAFFAFKGELSNNITIPGTKAAQVQDDLAGAFDMNADAGIGQAIVSTTDDSKITEQQQKAVAAALKKVDGIDGVDSTTDPFEQQKQVDDGRKQLEDGRSQLDQGEKQLAGAQQQIDAARAKIPSNAPASATQQIDQQQAQLDEQKKKIDEQKPELERNEKKLDLTSEYGSISEDGTTALTGVTFEHEINEVSSDILAEVRSAFEDTDLHGLDVQFDQNLEGMAEMGVTSEIIGMVIALRPAHHARQRTSPGKRTAREEGGVMVPGEWPATAGGCSPPAGASSPARRYAATRADMQNARVQAPGRSSVVSGSPEDGHRGVDEGHAAHGVCEAGGDLLTPLGLAHADERGHEHHQEDDELHADLGVVDPATVHLVVTHHAEARDEHQHGGPELGDGHGGALHGVDPGADDDGHTHDVQEEHEVEKKGHASRVTEFPLTH